MHIALDMDNVLADWDEGLSRAWRSAHPHRHPHFEHRTCYWAHEGCPVEDHEFVQNLHQSPGFYRQLPPVPGGLQAANEMKSLGWDVILLTSPDEHETCAQEKLLWVGEHLGPEWVPRTYIGLDKTRIQADFLVDDRPDITGVYRPTWEHVVFDRPYNRHITTHRRLTWLNWKRVLLASWLCLTFWAVGGI